MKRYLITLSLIILPLVAYSQKADIRIIFNNLISLDEWQILDDEYNPVVTSAEYMYPDTVFFALEANKRFFLYLSLSEIDTRDTLILTLSINNAIVLRINTDTEPGDHFYPFFTGIKTTESSKITGGTDTDISQFPWQVYIEADNFVCGGSIIGNDWIITAAHCARDDDNITIPPAEIDVIVGANNPRDPRDGKMYRVREVIVHENFDSKTLNNDLALLRLTEPVNYPNAEPIRLVSAKDSASGATDPGVMTWLTGYGITSVDPRVYPTTLQVVRLPIVTNAQASVVWKSIPESDMMAGYLDGNKDACTGDSGGPLVVPVNDEVKLAGLVSWGSSKCDTYGAYTRLTLFESWITAKTGIEISFKAPVPQGDSIICPGISSSNYEVTTVKDATAYDWLLIPENAGNLTAVNENATVSWNPEFYGKAAISIQVARADEISEKSVLNVTIAKPTSIISEPEDTVVCAEERAIVKLQAEGYNLDYAWYKNGKLLESASKNEVDILTAITDDSGNYFCEIEGSCGSAVSQTANLTVLPVTTITDINPDTELIKGNDLVLEATAEGHNLTYQWYKDESMLDTGISSILTINNVDATDIGLYKIIVTGTCGTETSRDVYIYVKNPVFEEDQDVLVWPTLTDNEVSIALDNDLEYNVMLFNTMGKLIKKIENCRYLTKLNIVNLPSGIYIVQIQNRDLRKSVKIIKK